MVFNYPSTPPIANEGVAKNETVAKAMALNVNEPTIKKVRKTRSAKTTSVSNSNVDTELKDVK